MGKSVSTNAPLLRLDSVIGPVRQLDHVRAHAAIRSLPFRERLPSNLDGLLTHVLTVGGYVTGAEAHRDHRQKPE